MIKGLGQPVPTQTLVRRLRLMADSGGMISKDRRRTIVESADRLEDLDERIAIMTEQDPVPDGALDFPPGGDDE